MKAVARTGRKTKTLVKRLRPQEVAVIDHADLDTLAALSLKECRPAAVLNAQPCLTGKYPCKGARILLQHGIPIIERLGEQIFSAISDGDVIEIRQNKVLKNGRMLAEGVRLTEEQVRRQMEHAAKNLDRQLDLFITNTFQYMEKEKGLWLHPLPVPELNVDLKNKHVLIVVRGTNYKEDLQAIKFYIRDQRPVLIGVDGGADALLELGYKPDLIVGDMDSVSDESLLAAKQVILHAYPDGRAPGQTRLEKLGVRASKIAAPGTSEDIALLLAHEKGARLIVAVGTHTHMIDFLEKGRSGMSSTILTRIKVGSSFVDAKGVSLLYRRPISSKYIWNLLVAALAPVAAVIAVSPSANAFLRLWWMQIRLSFGF